MTRRQLATWFLAGLPIALTGYAFFYFYIPNSEGYQAAVVAVRASPDVRSRVGEVQEVRRSPFGLFREQFAGSQRRVVLSLSVRGDRGESRIRIWMIERDKNWAVERLEFRDP
jgi:hypothetical protein